MNSENDFSTSYWKNSGGSLGGIHGGNPGKTFGGILSGNPRCITGAIPGGDLVGDPVIISSGHGGNILGGIFRANNEVTSLRNFC